MIDKKFILNNLNYVKEQCFLKNYNFDIVKFKKLEYERKNIQIEIDNLRLKIKNKGQNKKPIEKDIIIIKEINFLIKKMEKRLNEILLEIRNILLEIPNLPHKNCPIGDNEEDNVEIYKKGNIKQFDFDIKEHTELNEDLDFNTATNIATNRLVIMKNDTAKLNRALIQFMLDVQTELNKYEEYNVPVLVNDNALYGTGQLPKFNDDLYKLDNGLYLIPTAEVPLTNMFANKVLDLTRNIKATAFTQCFRKEAGTYGKDSKGMIRQHQFEKVELMQITKEDNAESVLNDILLDACKILDLLNLPYRVVELCSGDLGFGAKKTYDIEVWIPSQNKYREISSCTWFGDFQARRMNIKYKNFKGNKVFAHTLNGSGLAVGRTMVAIIENYQNEDGRITIPEVLKPYMNSRLNLN